MSQPAPTLGILVTVAPQTPEFRAFLFLADERLASGIKVYAYLLYDGVEGINDPTLQGLRNRGLILHACALAATERDIPNSDLAVFSGLVTLGQLIARCDEFKTFVPSS